MFDLRMVPMLSVVNIQFSRYPALWGTSIVEKGTTKASITSGIISKIVGTQNDGTTPGGSQT